MPSVENRRRSGCQLLWSGEVDESAGTATCDAIFTEGTLTCRLLIAPWMSEQSWHPHLDWTEMNPMTTVSSRLSLSDFEPQRSGSTRRRSCGRENIFETHTRLKVAQHTDRTLLMYLFEGTNRRVCVRVDLFGPLPDSTPEDCVEQRALLSLLAHRSWCRIASCTRAARELWRRTCGADEERGQQHHCGQLQVNLRSRHPALTSQRSCRKVVH